MNLKRETGDSTKGKPIRGIEGRRRTEEAPPGDTAQSSRQAEASEDTMRGYVSQRGIGGPAAPPAVAEGTRCEPRCTLDVEVCKLLCPARRSQHQKQATQRVSLRVCLLDLGADLRSLPFLQRRKVFSSRSPAYPSAPLPKKGCLEIISELFQPKDSWWTFLQGEEGPHLPDPNAAD